MESDLLNHVTFLQYGMFCSSFKLASSLGTPIVKPDWIYKVWADKDVTGIKADDKMVCVFHVLKYSISKYHLEPFITYIIRRSSSI